MANNNNKNKKNKEELDRLENDIRSNVKKIIDNIFSEKGGTEPDGNPEPDGCQEPDGSQEPDPKTENNKEAKTIVSDDNPKTINDDFWDLGAPKPRAYKKPDFANTAIPMTDITDDGGEDIRRAGYDTAEIGTEVPEPEKIEPAKADGIKQKTQRAADNIEPYRIPSSDIDLSDLSDLSDKSDEGQAQKSARETENTHTAITEDGRQTVVTENPKYRLGTYRRYGRSAVADQIKKQSQNQSVNPHEKRTVNVETRKYSPGGLLIREIEVKGWESDVDFYSRFTENAAANHNAKPSVPYTENYPPVKYFSYVPQYSHMSRSQLDYYRWVRENIRHGRFPNCDSTYIQLYIYEILNLPDLIPPETGVRELAAIWLAYRRAEPRLDGYLCEWLPDYCMIHGCPMPEALNRILPEIVPKAQFKEFFFDAAAKSKDSSGRELIARTLIENSSDYDYRRSRYYSANKKEYERHMTGAAAHVVANSIDIGSGIFALDRTYKMVRDSYCGAIVSADAKRRLGIEFLSFTRSAEARRAVTAVVKYSENKLRAVLGIKSKLSVDGLSAEDLAAVDEYFAPLLPAKQTKSKEDRYMPDDYLKNYEAEDHGFDFATAAEIERQSWQNTALLTSDEQNDGSDANSDLTGADDVSNTDSADDAAQEPAVPHDILSADDSNAGSTSQTPEVKSTEAVESGGHDMIKDALSMALSGRFHEFCTDKRMYDGELADKINTLFLEIIGDVVLSEDGGSFKIIEDYREDVEQWLNS